MDEYRPICADCGGSGRPVGAPLKLCETCAGYGWIASGEDAVKRATMAPLDPMYPQMQERSPEYYANIRARALRAGIWKDPRDG